MTSNEFDNFAELFREAEQRLKQIEHLTDELYVPAINELRYAGFHAVEAMTSTDARLRRESIEKAERHCKRAIFDVFEVGISFYLRAISLFRDDYRSVVITAVIPNYATDMMTVRAAQEFLASNSMHIAEPDWNAAMHCFEKLQTIYLTCESAREELNKSLNTQRKQLLNTLLGILIGLAGLIVAVIAIWL